MTAPAKADVQSPLLAARRIVLKIGSALLVDEATGKVRRDWLAALADDIAGARKRGQDVLIVSSGAIAVGRHHLGLHGRALKLEEKQAAAATGQSRLTHAYEEALAKHGITVAQVLLTFEDTEERRRHLNARGTLSELLKLGAIPVINENDTVATEEIRYGDNDRLAARVAQMVSADALILFSDIDGLYTADPRKDGAAQHLPEIRELTADVESMAGKAPPGYSSGGMVTKLVAARIAMAAGCRMAIANGRAAHPLAALIDGARCTWFVPPASPPAARKGWIAGTLKAAGTLVVDDGAVAALGKGKSLLPAGVVAVTGTFERGDTVQIESRAGKKLGRGLVAYSSADCARIVGHRSGEIEAILGYRGRDEMIHRDDLVIES